MLYSKFWFVKDELCANHWTVHTLSNYAEDRQLCTQLDQIYSLTFQVSGNPEIMERNIYKSDAVTDASQQSELCTQDDKTFL